MHHAATAKHITEEHFVPVDIIDRSQLDDIELPPSLPHLKQLIAYVMDQQARPEEKYGRWYQKSLLRQKFFSALSPRTGERISSGDSLLADGAIFYRFPSDPNLLLATAYSKMGEGYPIAGVICRKERLFLRLGDPTWGVQLPSVGKIERLLCAPQWRVANAAQEVRIITGDMNFAHLAWNQLGALEKFAQNPDSCTAIRINALFQPLGPLAELIPELARWTITPTGWSAFGESKPGRVDVFVGGTIVSNSIRDRILKVALVRASQHWRDTAERLAARHSPVVWISVRTANRTAANQRDALACLCKRIYALYPRCAIILDGYSLPDDFSTNESYDRASQNATVAGDRQEASALAARVKSAVRLTKRQDLVEAVGLTTPESVLLAHSAQFYICHHGTVQHKIGWLAAKPGVVHTNPRALQLCPAQWVSDQMEDPPKIYYLPEKLVGESGQDLSATEEDRSRLFDGYRFIDIEAFAGFVVQKLDETVGPEVERRLLPHLRLRWTNFVTDLATRVFHRRHFNARAITQSATAKCQAPPESAA